MPAASNYLKGYFCSTKSLVFVGENMKSIKNIVSQADSQSAAEKEKMLRAAWLVSLSAPISTAVAQYFGRTAILLADFLRRSNEFLALFLAWYVFIKICQLDSDNQEDRINKLERLSSIFMAVVMVISGIVIMYSAVSQILAPEEPGWLIPGLLINTGGLIVNSFFWYKNYKLDDKSSSVIMANQWKFYRAKASVDFMILASLLISNYKFLGGYSWLADPIGSIIVTLFIWYSAVKIIGQVAV